MQGRTSLKALALAASAALVAGSISTTASAELIYGTTLTGQLITWDSATPGTLLSGVAIQGLQTNEQVTGIDFRPATGQLYALGSFSRMYTINTTTGVATQVGAGAFTPGLNGSGFGMDFNPTVDRIRNVSNVDQNLRLHPDTGAVAFNDTALQYAAGDPNFGANPNVTHVAYTNNFAGATTTTLYGLDTGLDRLVTILPPNNGTLNTVGPIGADLTELGGFDISGATGIAYAAVLDANLSKSTFWTINLATGAGTAIGQVDGGVIITAMTVTPGGGAVPEPAAIALAGLGLAAVGFRRSRR